MYRPAARHITFKGVFTMTTKLHIGQTVSNFGVLAKVDGFHRVTGDPILRHFYNDGTRWIADATKCQPVKETAELWRHQNGLVGFR
jgi:hypothetical protein